MKSGRQREVAAIVAHDRAVEVGNLLMQKLDGPMRRIFPDEYLSMPRRQLVSGKASLRDGRARELDEFCRKNFGTVDSRRLAGLYERLYEHGSALRLPLREFADLIGQPQEGVLRDAPRHSTVDISPWGLQTEYPEMHLARDMAVALNSAISLHAEIDQHEGTPWEKIKQAGVRERIAHLQTCAAFNRRMCVLSCFNLLEAYMNGIAFGFADSHEFPVSQRTSRTYLRAGKPAF